MLCRNPCLWRRSYANWTLQINNLIKKNEFFLTFLKKKSQNNLVVTTKCSTFAHANKK